MRLMELKWSGWCGLRDGGGKAGFELFRWKGKWVRSRVVNMNSELDK